MRSDLRALSDAQLVVLANRGLVKRARKLVDRGDGPRIELEETPEGTTVRGIFSGDITSTLPPEVALADAPCTCSARKLCVHRIATVMAYAALPAEDSPEPGGPDTDPPPIAVDDDALLARLGKRVFQEACRARKAGYRATVRFGATPEVLLPTCTVRFLVPWELHHVRCECARGTDCVHVAMAVWAVAQAPAQSGEHEVFLGDPSEATGAGALGEAHALAQELVAQGWAGSTAQLKSRAAAVRDGLDRARAVWVVDALDELLEHISSYTHASATADVLAVSRELSELAFRARSPPTELKTRLGVHGQARSGATRLDHTRLQGLGARYRLRGGQGHLELFFQDVDSSDAMVLERRYPAPAPHGPELAGRRLLRSTLAVAASGSVVTRAATRRPNQVVELGGASQRLTSVTPTQGAMLLERAEDLHSLHQRLAHQPPALLRPRLRARRVVTVRWDSLEQLAWDPGSQTVWARVSQQSGGQAILHCEWRPETPGAPAAIAHALQQGVRCITAEARLRGGHLFLQPLLLVDDGPAVAPALAAERPLPTLPTQPLPERDGPLEQQLSRTELLLATCVQLGVHNLPAPTLQRLEQQACGLEAVGLVTLAAQLRQVAGACAASWSRAQARWAMLDHLVAVG